MRDYCFADEVEAGERMTRMISCRPGAMSDMAAVVAVVGDNNAFVGEYASDTGSWIRVVVLKSGGRMHPLAVGRNLG